MSAPTQDRQDGKLTAAMVLAIVGGVLGLFAGLFAIFVGGVGTALEVDDAGLTGGLGVGAFALAVAGIVGGALARSRPVASTVLTGVAGVLGFVAVSAFWLLSGPLLILAAILTWVGRPREA